MGLGIQARGSLSVVVGLLAPTMAHETAIPSVIAGKELLYRVLPSLHCGKMRGFLHS
jgi:hypothetical protein